MATSHRTFSVSSCVVSLWSGCGVKLSNIAYSVSVTTSIALMGFWKRVPSFHSHIMQNTPCPLVNSLSLPVHLHTEMHHAQRIRMQKPFENYYCIVRPHQMPETVALALKQKTG